MSGSPGQSRPIPRDTSSVGRSDVVEGFAAVCGQFVDRAPEPAVEIGHCGRVPGIALRALVGQQGAEHELHAGIRLAGVGDEFAQAFLGGVGGVGGAGAVGGVGSSGTVTGGGGTDVIALVNGINGANGANGAAGGIGVCL
ncbi:hypothetical protein AB0F52_44135 [Amycolatopsis sp. NPDC024027]|uniref:hypothetical protein n=1 Tax=Amycolatopsis sp. NPDC024027 TaxID=3154327 RepID=UPI0033EF7CD9